MHVIRVAGEFDIAACEQFREKSASDGAELVVVDLRRGDVPRLERARLS